MKVISNAPKKSSYNCYSGSVCYLMERDGILLSEAMSFGLSKGLNFMVEVGQKEIQYRAVRSLHCLTEFIETLGVKVEEYIADNFEQTMSLIKKRVDQDQVLMIDYDGYYLPFTQIYKKEHERRICLVVGYSEDAVIVSDFIYQVYEYEVPLELFRRSRDQNLGACVQRKWYEVQYPDNINQKISSELVRDALLNVSEYFLQEGSSEEGLYVGIKGMRAFAADFPQLIQRIEQEELQADWMEMSEDFKQTVIIFSHFADYLRQLADTSLTTLDKEQLLMAADFFMENSKSWRIICSLFFKAGLLKKANVAQGVPAHLLEVADRLEKVFTLIKEDI